MATVRGHDEGGRRLIDSYLTELAVELDFHGVGSRRAARILAEARDHLLELAVEHGEEEAVERFGPARQLAAEAARAARPVVLFRSTLVFAAALALFVLPLYGIPENTLPPAPWDERPAHLTWKLYVSVGAFAVAVPLALLAVAAAWLRLRRIDARRPDPRRHLAHDQRRSLEQSAPSSGRRPSPAAGRRFFSVLARPCSWELSLPRR